MLLIKIGGSLIAPKNKKGIDKNYLIKISNILHNIKNIIIIHGTGNIGHKRIKSIINNNNTNIKKQINKYYNQGRKKLDFLFNQIDYFFPNFKRIYIKDLKKNNLCKGGKYIIGGDITKEGNIISSDKIFAEILDLNCIKYGIMLTDIDGVLDINKNIIKYLNKYNIKNIYFWNKNNDVTGGMKGKIYNLINKTKTVYICNGYNIKNLQNIISKKNLKKFIGTIIN